MGGLAGCAEIAQPRTDLNTPPLPWQAGSPVTLDAKLTVNDSPNSAGVVVDAIRFVQVARELGIVGSLRGPSAATQKSPPKPLRFADATAECDALAGRKLTATTAAQVRDNARDSAQSSRKM